MNTKTTLKAILLALLIHGKNSAVSTPQEQPNFMHNYALLGLALASVAVKEHCTNPCKGNLLALSPQLVAVGHMAYRGYITDAVERLRWQSLKKDKKPFGTLLQSGSTLLFAGATLYKVWELSQKQLPASHSRRGSTAGLDGAAVDDASGHTHHKWYPLL